MPNKKSGFAGCQVDSDSNFSHTIFRRKGLATVLLSLLALTALSAHATTLTMTAPDDAFFCTDSIDVTFTYTPDAGDPPVLRGYSVRIIAPYGLDYEQADIMVYSPLPGVEDTHLFIQNDINDFTIDFTFLELEVGLSDAADLFTITFRDRGFNFPNAPIGIEAGIFRTPENADIVVDISDILPIDVICVAPDATTVNPEPTYSPGTTNTVSWKDMWYTGAVDYNAQVSTDPDFLTTVAESGWQQILQYEFTDLVDGTIYYFKVNCRSGSGKISNDSNIVYSTQDGNPPTTSLLSLAPTLPVTDFDIHFNASDDLSGFVNLELFFRYEGGAFNSFGEFDTSPIAFDAFRGDGFYEFYALGTDVAGNVEPIPVDPETATTLDTSEPYGSFVVNADAEGTNNPATALIMSVIRADEMRFSNDGATWDEGWVPFAGVHPWTIPATEGSHTVHGEFRDTAQNVLEANDSIIYDITPPGGITAPTAQPGHETTFLTWTNPADPDFRRVEVWRGLVHDGSHGSTYPTYTGGTVPAPPADRAAALASPEWELAGLAEIGATSFIDSVATRGIYHYEFFATDLATNYSPPEGSLPRATNYILGDVVQPHDGAVLVDDKTLLSSVYGLATADPDFSEICDVGPTDNALGTGIPQPDGLLDTEDKMIFGMNYAPSAKSSSDGIPGPTEAEPVRLSWRPAGDHTWDLDLVTPRPDLKGVILKAALANGGIAVVNPGEAVTSGVDPFSLQNIDHHGLDAGLVVLGAGRGVANTGTLLTLTLPAGSALDIQDVRLDLRDLDNRKIAYEIQGKSAEMPAAVFRLEAATPNPFNPATTLKFSIPDELPVRLEIYGLDGRRVAVLVDEILARGNHEAVWLGRDESGRRVASGVYFSRLQAGPDSQVLKMTLMK